MVMECFFDVCGWYLFENKMAEFWGSWGSGPVSTSGMMNTPQTPARLGNNADLKLIMRKVWQESAWHGSTSEAWGGYMGPLLMNYTSSCDKDEEINFAEMSVPLRNNLEFMQTKVLILLQWQFLPAAIGVCSLSVLQAGGHLKCSDLGMQILLSSGHLLSGDVRTLLLESIVPALKYWWDQYVLSVSSGFWPIPSWEVPQKWEKN